MKNSLQNELEGVINETKERGQSVILMPDVNARTEKDSVRAPPGERNYKARQSKDAVQNAEGKRLLSFCEENGLTIMNGRCEGDREGNCTYVGEQGEEGSAIDYVIITEGKDYVMERMKVEIRIESDHLLIAVDISRGGKVMNRKKIDSRVEKRQEKILMWKEEMDMKYKE